MSAHYRCGDRTTETNSDVTNVVGGKQSRICVGELNVYTFSDVTHVECNTTVEFIRVIKTYVLKNFIVNDLRRLLGNDDVTAASII